MCSSISKFLHTKVFSIEIEESWITRFKQCRSDSMMPVSVNDTKITVKGSINLQCFASFADCVYSSINISQANPLVQDKHIFL